MAQLEELRTETLLLIKRQNLRFKAVDKLCWESKNVYNKAIYTLRDYYTQTGKSIRYPDLDKIFRSEFSDLYKKLPSQTTQQTLMLACQAFKGFIEAKKDYYKNPKKYKAEPKMPNYRNKINGRYAVKFSNQQVRYKEGYIVFPESTGLDPMETRLDLTPIITDQDTIFEPTKHNLIREVRIVPRSNDYKVELVYLKEIEVPDVNPTKITGILAIDLGINNYATMVTFGPDPSKPQRPIILTGRGLKSYNKNFNYKLASKKRLAEIYNHVKTTRAIRDLYSRRDRVFSNFYHANSRYIINYCLDNCISDIIIGYNEGWKQKSSLSKKVNQSFIQIGFLDFIKQIEYKAKEHGIRVIRVNESYTSGTSYLDRELPIKDNYNIKRRINRGTFKSNTGITINSDVNAAYQILVSVYPQFTYNQSMPKESFEPIKEILVEFKRASTEENNPYNPYNPRRTQSSKTKRSVSYNTGMGWRTSSQMIQ